MCGMDRKKLKMAVFVVVCADLYSYALAPLMGSDKRSVSSHKLQ